MENKKQTTLDQFINIFNDENEEEIKLPKNIGKIISIYGKAINSHLKDFIKYINENYDIIPISPKKICYCGSLRVAKEAFQKAEYEAVLKGEIALLPCCMFVDIQREYGAESDYKLKADDLHKCKIDICDEVFVLNVNGYIGESTRSEIEYAKSIHKPVIYLEDINRSTSM